jgi:hypothetical protein
MNPVPRLSFDNELCHSKNNWNGVNVPNFPEGKSPKATNVSPWYGVYQSLPIFSTITNAITSLVIREVVD